MPAAATPPRPRWRVVLLAALTAVLGLLLPASSASAAPLPAVETRVGVPAFAAPDVVGVHECITAGQRPVRGPSQLQMVVGNCVAAEGVRLSAGEGLERAPGTLVRNVAPSEKMGALCDELCSLTYSSGREHALVKTSTGFQIHSGGATGIDLSSDVTQVLAHTHPYHLPALGPSADDVAMLSRLGQSSSILLEHGQTILFGRGGTIAWR